MSASRRTDLLACRPQQLVDAIEGRTAATRVLRPEKIHTLLISTKDYRNILDIPELGNACGRCGQVCFNLTVTGLGGTALEPHVPRPADLLARLEELCDYVGDPRRITWCFDPVVTWGGITNMSVPLFEELAGAFGAVRVERVMAMYYFPYGNSRIHPEIPEEAERVEFAQSVDGICRTHGLSLSFCHVPGLHRCKCVDVGWFSQLHPNRDDSVVDHYKNDRPLGRNCHDAVWDIGWYLPACRHGCLYCYGKAAGR